MKKVLITGAASGIGKCIAEEFASAGCELILVDIDQDRLIETADELSGKYNCIIHDRMADISNYNSMRLTNMIYNPIDILINNAGIGFNKEIANTTVEEWKKLIEVNLLGPINGINAFLPGMIKQGHGHIANVSSGQVFFKLPTWGAYAATKAALGVLSEVLSMELRKYNINVTTVYPFMVNTKFHSVTKMDRFASRLSIKLLPYYADSPEKVGRLVFDAIRKNKKVEMVSPVNTIGKYANLFPFMSNSISFLANKLLSDKG